MKIYCMSDIHGHLKEFEDALSLVLPHLSETDTRLILLGDYIHMGPDSRGVMDRIMALQNKYGNDKVCVLMGNHEYECLQTGSCIGDETTHLPEDKKYYDWMKTLKYFRQVDNTVFVHAGIEEDAGELWKFGTPEYIMVGKYPASLGQIPELDIMIVSGHIGTASISGDPSFHDIYYDGESHYYIDGSVYDSGVIPVLLADTDNDRFYRVTAGGNEPVKPYKK